SSRYRGNFRSGFPSQWELHTEQAPEYCDRRGAPGFRRQKQQSQANKAPPTRQLYPPGTRPRAATPRPTMSAATGGNPAVQPIHRLGRTAQDAEAQESLSLLDD